MVRRCLDMLCYITTCRQTVCVCFLPIYCGHEVRWMYRLLRLFYYNRTYNRKPPPRSTRATLVTVLLLLFSEVRRSQK